MGKKLINVGVEPGGQGDGDSLRNAFIKTRDNFDELYSSSPITDVTLDHSDPGVEGTIAQQLAACEASGGGTVYVGPGKFNLSSASLTIGANCQLVGAGKNATILIVRHQFNAIRMSTGKLGLAGFWAIRDIAINLPTSVSGNGIVTEPSQGSSGVIENVLITGGSQSSWCIDMDGANGITITDSKCDSEGNGIRWWNSANYNVNYGDSLIQATNVVLRNPYTTGIQLASPTAPSISNRRINNILISRVEVHTPDGVVRAGTIGVALRNTARITLLHVDIEHVDTALLHESGVDGGAVAVNNAFIQIFPIGCNTDYLEIGSSPAEQVIMGGQGAFADQQRFPSSEILAAHQILGNNRVLTAVRPIESHSNSAITRILTVEDSGKIFTNRGANGTVLFELPPANLSYSVEYEFHLATAGYAIRVQPVSYDLIRPGQGSSGFAYESGKTFGHVLKIRNIDGTTWSTLVERGTWTSV